MNRLVRACGVVAAAIMMATPMAVSGQIVSGTVQGMPPRDAPPVPQTGTGAISGRVVDAATGAPVPRARVRLLLGMQRDPVLADAQGRFAFTNLPPGTWSVGADKATYLPGRYPEAGLTLRSMARPRRLGNAEAIDDITVRLYRAGAISGRVLDQHGDPIESADVRVMRVQRGGTPQMRASQQTNDIGEFRIARLDPGSYILMAAPNGRGEPSLAVESIPTYYPGVLTADQAAPIVLERGQQLSAVDLVVAEGTTSLVTGQVVDTAGEAVTSGAFVGARQLPPGGIPGGSWNGGSSVGRDGTFKLRLTPGDYDLEVNVMPQPAPGQVMVNRTELSGTARVSVSSASVSDVRIIVGQQASVSGRLIFDGSRPLPANPGQLRIGFSSQDGSVCRSGQSEIQGDWTFTVTGVRGTCLPNIPSGMGGWMVRSVTYKGDDWLAKPIVIEPGEKLSGVEVVFTDTPTELTLTVADDRGQPTREYVALVFSTDRERWTTPGWRYLRTHVPQVFDPSPAPHSTTPGAPTVPRNRPDIVTGLLAGEYYAVAVEDIETEDVHNPAMLRQLMRSAVRVTIAEGLPAAVSLRLQASVVGSSGR